MANWIDLAIPGPDKDLKRLGCALIILEKGQTTERICYPHKEAIYYVTSGYLTFVVASSGADWDYPMQQEMVMWIDAGAEHYLHNDGEGVLRLICFKTSSDGPSRPQGKAIRRKLINIWDVPREVRVGRDLRIVLRGSEIGSECMKAFESGCFPPGIGTPLHSEEDTEEVFYFVRGRGTAIRGNEKIDVKAGDVLNIAGGLPHCVTGSDDHMLGYVVCSARI